MAGEEYTTPPVDVTHNMLPVRVDKQYTFQSLAPTYNSEPSGERAGEDCTFPPVRVDHRCTPVELYDRMYLSSLPRYSDPSPPTLAED